MIAIDECYDIKKKCLLACRKLLKVQHFFTDGRKILIVDLREILEL